MDVSKPAAKPRHFTELRTHFDAEEARRRLVDGIDPEERALFCGYRFSGYKGSKPLIGRVEGQQFYLFKRRYRNHELYPIFFGHFVPEEQGTKIEGYFDVRPRARSYLQMVTVLGIIVTLPLFLLSLTDVFQGSHYMRGSLAWGLFALPGFVVAGFFLPKFGLWLSKNDEKFILDFLHQNLFAANASTGERTTA